jgi:hypothetical protein
MQRVSRSSRALHQVLLLPNDFETISIGRQVISVIVAEERSAESLN